MKIAAEGQVQDPTTGQLIALLGKAGIEPNQFLEEFRAQVEEEATSNGSDGDEYGETEFPCNIDGEIEGVEYGFTGRGSAFWDNQGRDYYLDLPGSSDLKSWYITGTLELFDTEGETIGSVKLWRWN